jgi:hypothetical protein
MRKTGPIRHTERRTCWTVANRETPRIAFGPGTALPGPVLTSGPGIFAGSLAGRLQTAIPESVPTRSYCQSSFRWKETNNRDAGKEIFL